MATVWNGQKSSPAKLQARQLQLKALELRLQGLSYQEIGERIGRSDTWAYRLVMRAMRETIQEPADKVRELETSRLEKMLARVWPMIEEGNLQAIDRGVRIIEVLAKINGLYSDRVTMSEPVKMVVEYVNNWRDVQNHAAQAAPGADGSDDASGED